MIDAKVLDRRALPGVWDGVRFPRDAATEIVGNVGDIAHSDERGAA
ncbi:hypothetical protein [Phytohabitans rumicis]|nr:hypothetical protein [Phytohabitans rumicis]